MSGTCYPPLSLHRRSISSTGPGALGSCQWSQALLAYLVDPSPRQRRRQQPLPWWNYPAAIAWLRSHPQIGPDKVAALLAVYRYREPEETEEDVAWRFHLSMASIEAWQRTIERLLKNGGPDAPALSQPA